MKVSVIGCGRVGLPLALLLAARGHEVVAVEVDARVRDAVSRGRMPFTDPFSEPYLAETLGRTFSITGDLAVAARQCQAFVVCIGTPLGPGLLPDLSAVAGVAEGVLEGLSGKGGPVPGRPATSGGPEPGGPPAIIIRSTVVPGMTDGLIRSLERRFGLKAGRDFFVAFCPERTLEGRSDELLELPQIIGARDEASRDAARRLFEPLGVELVDTGLVEAEMAKLACNAYRYIAFALSNELMMIAQSHGARVHEVLKAANQGYKRGGIPSPGYASGPCLFKDGLFLGTRFPAVDLLLAGWKINETLPEYFIALVERIRPLVRPVVLGLAFKADCDDTRNSLGLKLARLLEARGHEVAAHDPHVTRAGADSDLRSVLSGAREIFVTVPHRQYRETQWTELTRLAGRDCIVADPWLVWGQDDVVTRLVD